jgi:hypothetical protein
MLRRVESRRFGVVKEGSAAGARPLIGPALPPWATQGLAAVGHDARNPAAVPTTAGIWPHRPVLPTVGGILTPCPTAAGTWTHRSVLPAVGGTLTSCPRGVRRHRYISRKFCSAIYFSKIMTK